jgi:hypothetical protein
MACWYVLRTQHWAIKYAQDGDLSECDREDIAEFVGWPDDPNDWVDAMTVGGFIDLDSCLHDRQKYGGKYIRAREKGNERQAKYRAKLDRALTGDHLGDASRDGPSTVSDRKDKRRGERRSRHKTNTPHREQDGGSMAATTPPAPHTGMRARVDRACR